MTDAEKQIRKRLEAFDRLRVARGQAIQNYAQLEYALCSLFTHLLQTTPDMAATVFYRNANARSRNMILSKLLQKRHGADYGAFWKSAVKRIKGLDDRRNEIVHWHEATDFFENEAGDTMIGANLIAPNYWDRTSASRSLGVDELRSFSLECDFITRSLNMFLLLLMGRLSDPSSPWHELCRQPVTYPPPDDHPLSRAARETF